MREGDAMEQIIRGIYRGVQILREDSGEVSEAAGFLADKSKTPLFAGVMVYFQAVPILENMQSTYRASPDLFWTLQVCVENISRTLNRHEKIYFDLGKEFAKDYLDAQSRDLGLPAQRPA